MAVITDGQLEYLAELLERMSYFTGPEDACAAAGALVELAIGVLDFAPGQTAVGLALKGALEAIPVSVFGGGQRDRLLRLASDQKSEMMNRSVKFWAERLRYLARGLERARDARNHLPNPEIELEGEAELRLPDRQSRLVLLLLKANGRTAHENRVVRSLWPVEGKIRPVPWKLLNRLAQLQHRTNESLFGMTSRQWKIYRRKERPHWLALEPL